MNLIKLNFEINFWSSKLFFCENDFAISVGKTTSTTDKGIKITEHIFVLAKKYPASIGEKKNPKNQIGKKVLNWNNIFNDIRDNEDLKKLKKLSSTIKFLILINLKNKWLKWIFKKWNDMSNVTREEKIKV